MTATTTNASRGQIVQPSSTKKYEIKWFVRLAFCPCGGEMESTRQGMSNNNGSYWQHKCKSCGIVEWYDTVYPHPYYSRC